ncbi:MAG: sigma-70 family RNA polymerase sigma factor [Candidatus Gastranaerophilales bacterium]|nr:sigma-70 family RNA polymerase sigma factor [Candidatus Gastranaerophilales bacterium]
MEITQEHRALIENIIKTNNRFKGNEDLLEDFCSETFQRTYSILSSINNVEKIENYIRKVSTTAIIEVLRTAGRLTKTSGKYQKTNETVISEIARPKQSTVNDLDPFFDIPDPKPHFEESIITQDELQKIKKVIYELDYHENNKKFADIFVMRYIKEYKQAEIAEKLGISQGEVSKRLIKIAKEVNKKLNAADD